MKKTLGCSVIVAGILFFAALLIASIVLLPLERIITAIIATVVCTAVFAGIVWGWDTLERRE